ncbi:MAG: hypothetical protein GX446_17670 [Chthonomonadales bacterium]|nr:hypothetical protein [Chthonomonadales bacterium]
MRLARERIAYSSSFEGHAAPEGFILLDLKGLDLEGVTTLVLDGEHIRLAREQGQRRQEAAQQLRMLLDDNSLSEETE